MLEILPEKLKELAEACDFPLYVVGGTCREYLSGLKPAKRDYDICAPVLPGEVKKIAEKTGFTVCSVYKNTGTVKLKCGSDEYEFTSFRSDEYVRGKHVPETICFTDDINKDAIRRDFTCNAVYFDISAGRFADPLGGIEDIKKGTVRTVAPSEKVFGEDGLRLMRLARLCGTTGFEPNEACMRGAAENAHLISDISAERIYSELNSILHADSVYGMKHGQYRALCILKDTGVMGYILPELAAGDGMDQRQDFHAHDVLEHSLRCVMYSADDIRFAALLHDVGKPYCKMKTGVFHGHETEGERIVRAICARLKAPKKLTDETARLTALHMYDTDGKMRESKVRSLIVKNIDIFFKLLELKRADYSACKDDLSEAPSAVRWRKIYETMRSENVPFSLKDLKVRGDELIAEGVPAEKTGRVLEALLAECAILPSLNEHDRLLSAAKRIEKEL